MKNLYDKAEAPANDDLALRVYTSRLLGQEADLVLHGGGNTSVKTTVKDFFGNFVEVLCVKGSGWDLATIEKPGFPAVRMETLLKLAELDTLSDADMVEQQRLGLLDPAAPNPSIEAIVHAVIPSKYVDHTHADAILALTNNPDGKKHIKECFGDSMIVVPYVMPGFVLAKAVQKAIAGKDLSKYDGMILMNHGIFTFDDDAKKSYDLMIKKVTEAEKYIAKHLKDNPIKKAKHSTDLLGLAALRKAVSTERGTACIAKLSTTKAATAFAAADKLANICKKGPVTPDHTIRTKRLPLYLADGGDAQKAATKYSKDYTSYFDKHATKETILDTAPRWAAWQNHGVVSFGATLKEANVIADIAEHSVDTILKTEHAFGAWKALPAKDLFEIEYWELEQAKLNKGNAATPPHQGKVALVTGAAAGIGFACAEQLALQGATVIGADLNPEIIEAMASFGGLGIVANLTDDAAIKDLVETIVSTYGGLDILVSNAGIFTAGAYLEDLEQSNWEKSFAVNLTSHQKLLRETIPFIKLGLDGAIVLVGSRNVNAPGAGAASYSCAKAGLNQLCRVAALELAPEGVRCNIIHPDAVFDTKLWTPENLKRSAERYGLTVEEYKTRNLLKTEIKSANIGQMVSAMASPLFGKTTGAQIPVDGGNDRII
ncbi:bifunctional aldolase/short-chain dehydrogenase [Rubritalea marina]|uniref:bifunctional aldolase/short-chain dehydrogenase n=1 Tax=Rubritalea marina TaxID=361055 RepID=UPI00037EDF30|nr:bifunctional aldolase/short-chain dehydrogenase [Rubritalea marina]